MKRWLIILSLAGITGCARFAEHPLVPAQTAAQLDARGLEAPGLRQFMAGHLGHPLPVWPLPEWDLTSLTLAAFYYHPSLAVARAQWAVTQADIKTAAGRPNPSVTVTPGYDSSATSISPWLPMINFDWPLETAGKRGKRLAEARALANSAQWDIVTTAWQVRGTLRDTLLDAQAAERRQALLTQQAALQEQLVSRLEQRLAAGDIARTDLVTAQLARQKIRLDQLDADSRASEARSRLAGAIGLSRTALTGVRINWDTGTNLPPALNASEARKLALVARSDIRGALADYAAAEADLQLEIAKQYPDVHLSPGYQYNQGDNQWTLGLSVELPVLNQNQGPIASAAAKRQLAAAKFLAVQARVISDLDRAVAAWQLAQAQTGSGDRWLATEAAQAAATAAQVAAGAGDQFDILAAQLELTSARLVQLDNTTQLLRARGALEDAWQRPLDSLNPEVFKQLSATTIELETHP